MEQIRKPFQGVWNVVRFNWDFFLFAFAMLLVILLFGVFSSALRPYSIILFSIALAMTLISLLVTYYVYDLSELYSLSWADSLNTADKEKIVNINAGFDEMSVSIADKFKNSELAVFDFYDPLKHTEASIKRARKAYPPYPNTVQIATSKIPLSDNSVDKAFGILSIHEIRDPAERTIFFRELRRILKPTGQIVIIEHLRDAANFAAYNIGAFHFHSKNTWLKNFQAARFEIEREVKITPFISAFILKKYGSPS